MILIIESKSISDFSSQVILSDVRYHKYHHHLYWQISCKSVTVATRQHDLSFACLTSECRPIFSCVRSFSTLRVQVVLRRSFCYFHPAAVFLSPPEKLSDNHPLGDSLATWSNKYNWFKWVMSSDKIKTLAWNRTSWCKLQSFLNSVPFFNNALKF